MNIEKFEEVFKAAIQGMHQENVRAYGSLMANVMLPGLEALKPVFKATYDQGVKDEQEKLKGSVVVPKDHVVVPKVPSQEMIQAGLEKVRESWDENPPDGFNSFMWGDMIETWKDMVEAARGGNE